MAVVALPRARERWLPRLKDPAFLIPLAGVIVIAYLALFPLVMLLRTSFTKEITPRESVFTLENYAKAFASSYTYSTIFDTVTFAAASALLAFVMATVLAWLVERTNTPGRKIFLPIVVVPLILPGVLEVIAWIFLLSPRFGYLNVAIMGLFGLKDAPFDVFSFGGMVWIQAIGQVPLAFLLMVAAFKSMDPTLEESAMASGASPFATMRRITLRLVLPAAASVLLILFVRSLEATEVPTIVGIPAKKYLFTSEIYRSFTGLRPDYGYGAALGVALLLLTGIGVLLYTRATRRTERFQTVTGKAFRPRQFDLGHFRWVSAGILFLYFGVVVMLPVLVLLWSSLQPFMAPPTPENLAKLTFANYGTALREPLFQRAMVNSVVLALGTATFVTLLTALIAWVVYRSKLPGRSLLDYLAFLPIAVPGLVLGLGMITFYVAFPIGIYGTIWIMLLAYCTKYLPYGMRAASGAIVQIHRELEEAAGAAGASFAATFWKVTLPLLRPGLVAGWIYVCIITFREFSTSILLASGENQVLSILIFTMYEQGQAVQVAAIGIMMVLVLLTIVAIFYRLTGKIGIQGA